MNQSSSSTADVHTTEVITTPGCQTSYCSQDHIYCCCKGKSTSLSQLLYSPFCQLSCAPAYKAGMQNSLRPDFVQQLWGRVFCHKRYLNFQGKPSCFCYIQEYALYKTHKYYKEDVLNNRIILQIIKLTILFILITLSIHTSVIINHHNNVRMCIVIRAAITTIFIIQ